MSLFALIFVGLLRYRETNLLNLVMCGLGHYIINNCSTVMSCHG